MKNTIIVKNQVSNLKRIVSILLMWSILACSHNKKCTQKIEPECSNQLISTNLNSLEIELDSLLLWHTDPRFIADSSFSLNHRLVQSDWYHIEKEISSNLEGTCSEIPDTLDIDTIPVKNYRIRVIPTHGKEFGILFSISGIESTTTSFYYQEISDSGFFHASKQVYNADISYASSVELNGDLKTTVRFIGKGLSFEFIALSRWDRITEIDCDRVFD